MRTVASSSPSEIRNRIQARFQHPPLMPVSKKDIDNTLVSSGYRPDSALSPNDIKRARQARARRRDHRRHGHEDGRWLQGERARCSCRATSRCRSRCSPLESANLGDVAKQVVREYDAARKQLSATQECENGIREQEAGRRHRRRAQGSVAPIRESTHLAALPRERLSSPGRHCPTPRRGRGRIRSSP